MKLKYTLNDIALSQLKESLKISWADYWLIAKASSIAPSSPYAYSIWEARRALNLSVEAREIVLDYVESVKADSPIFGSNFGNHCETTPTHP